MSAAQQEYLRLRQSGVSEDDAFRQALEWKQGLDAGPPMATPEQEAARPQYSPLESAGIGATNPFGWTDELMGALNAVYPADPRAQNAPAYQNYREMQSGQEAIDAKSAQDNPWSHKGTQIGAGAALTFGLAAPESLGGAMLSGAGQGAITGAGESQARPLEGEVAPFALDTVEGAAIGAGAGALGHGITKGGSAVYRKLFKSPEEQAFASATPGAKKLVKKVDPNAKSQVGFEDTQGEAFGKASGLEEHVSKKIGEDYQLRLSQKTGNAELGGLEDASRYYTKEHQAMLEQGAKQAKQTEQFLDMTVSDLAANPSALDKATTGGLLEKTLDDHIGSLRKIRSDSASPLYKAAEEAGANVDLASTKAALEDVAQRNRFNLSDAVPRIKTLLNELTDAKVFATSERHPVTIQTVQNLRSALTELLESDGTIIQNMSKSKQRQFAHEILNAIDDSLNKSALEGNAGAQLLQQANAEWRKHSGAIEEVTTDTVKKLLRVGADDAPDAVTQKFLAATPEQIRGVFKILGKADPEAAQQIRAQLLEDIFTQAGKSPKGGFLAQEMGRGFNASTAADLMQKNASKLEAAFAGDTNAMLQLRTMADLLKRVGAKVNTGGAASQSATNAAIDVMSRGAAGYKGWALSKFLRSVVNNESEFVKVLSSSEGIEAFNQAMRGTLQNNLSDEAAQSIINSLTHAGLTVKDTYEEPKEKRPFAGGKELY